MTDFGSGLELDQDLDLVVTPSGDLSTVSGFGELQKDLSFRLMDELDGLGTMVLSKDVEDRLKAIVSGAIRDDPRIEAVRHVGIRTASGSNSHLKIGVDAVTAEGPFEMVLEV